MKGSGDASAGSCDSPISAFKELMPWDEPLPPDELAQWQRTFATAERLIGNRKAMKKAQQLQQ